MEEEAGALGEFDISLGVKKEPAAVETCKWSEVTGEEKGERAGLRVNEGRVQQQAATKGGQRGVGDPSREDRGSGRGRLELEREENVGDAPP